MHKSLAAEHRCFRKISNSALYAVFPQSVEGSKELLHHCTHRIHALSGNRDQAFVFLDDAGCLEEEQLSPKLIMDISCVALFECVCIEFHSKEFGEHVIAVVFLISKPTRAHHGQGILCN